MLLLFKLLLALLVTTIGFSLNECLIAESIKYQIDTCESEACICHLKMDFAMVCVIYAFVSKFYCYS